MSYRFCNFYLNDTFLFVTELVHLPPEGTLLDYTDAAMSTTQYRVNDVILELQELAAVPGNPENHPVPRSHTPRWRLDVTVVP